MIRTYGLRNLRKSHIVAILQAVKQMKRFVTKQIGLPLWQKSFHDHIIRNERNYQEIWEYIDTNPLKWKDDCYFE